MDRRALVLLASLLAACSSEASSSPDASTPGDSGPALPDTLGPAERPARLVIPPAHDGTTPLPIVFLLHGYTASASLQDIYFRASITARELGYYLVLPDGTIDSGGDRFWNATPACCDFGGTGVDDVAYLTSLLDEAEALLPIDTTRVYFYGHSNGGFMSFRMACELSERITAIASLAGSDFAGDMDCVPSRPVSVLQVHGTLDESVAYEAEALHPSARDVVVRWAGRAGCDTTMPSTGEPMDLESVVAGAETRVEQFRTGCMPGLDAELWTMDGVGHIPTFQRSWGTTVAEWLLRHHR